MFTLLIAKNVQQKLQSFIEYHQLFNNSDQLAIAISGGKDSVCAAHLFNKLSYPFHLVHCNFNLRGEESDGDELFVRELSKELEHCKGIYVASFNTLHHSKSRKISVQEAARELRYDYFNTLKEEGKITKVITAHHKTDSIETFFINLYRSTGIQGLKGIPVKRDFIIRPMMAFEGTEISNYIDGEAISYREDSSNSSNSYLRNTIRNKVLPHIQDVLPDFNQRVLKSIDHLGEGSELFAFLIDNQIETLTLYDLERKETRIQKSSLDTFPQADVFLYYMLDGYGFTRSQCSQICFNSSTGALFYSSSHKILVNDEEIILNENTEIETLVQQVDNFGDYHFNNWRIRLSEAKIPDNLKQAECEFADSTLFEFPLTIRYWKEGDFIVPLGMHGSKLLSDFFIDLKIDRNQRLQTPLLAKGNEIYWILGYRISDKIKITDQTLCAVKLDFFKT